MILTDPARAEDAPLPGGPRVLALDTEGLGDRSYLAHDGEVALVVDPQRDVDRVLTWPRRPVCGSRTWSRHTSTTTTSPAATRWPARPARAYLVNADDPVTFERVGVRDGDVLGPGR